jgi:hypothetical protein
MDLNRRNVLIGLGTVTAGSGVIFGTGAFSTVEADRTVSVETSQDTDALVGLEITDPSIAASDGTSDTTIEFDETALNLDALTTYENALRVSDNSDNTGIYVSIDDGTVGSAGSSLIRTSDPGSSDPVGLYLVADNGDTITGTNSDEWLDVGDGSSVDVDVVVNTLGETDSSTNPLSGVDSIRVEAQSDDPSTA